MYIKKKKIFIIIIINIINRLLFDKKDKIVFIKTNSSFKNLK